MTYRGSVPQSRQVLNWHEACVGVKTRDVAHKILSMLNDMSNRGILDDKFKATITITPSLHESELDIIIEEG